MTTNIQGLSTKAKSNILYVVFAFVAIITVVVVLHITIRGLVARQIQNNIASDLIGLTNNKSPEKVEKDLRAIVPPERGNDLCHRFVLHGRACCVARRPQCEECCLNQICCFAIEKNNRKTEEKWIFVWRFAIFALSLQAVTSTIV